MQISFDLVGIVRGQGRPRFGHGRAYKAEEDKAWEDKIRMAYHRGRRGLHIRKGAPVFVTIEAVKAVPASWSKKRQLEAQGKFWDGKPDADNIAKSVLDALNRTAWDDDKQVTGLTVTKMYGAYDHLHITIAEAEEEEAYDRG